MPVEPVGPLKIANLQTYLTDEPIKKKTLGPSRVEVIEGKRRRIKGPIKILEVPRKRTGVNRILKRLRFVWTWAVRKELIPAWCLDRIKTVLGNRQRVGDDEKEILPVPDQDLLATLGHLPLFPANDGSISAVNRNETGATGFDANRGFGSLG